MSLHHDLDQFRRSLEARGLSKRTIGGYTENTAAYARWADAEGLPTETEDVTSEHIEKHLATMREAGLKPSTVETRYRGLRQFFAWAEGRGKVDDSPMLRMQSPKVPDSQQKMVSDSELEALRAAIPETSREFDDLRDRAIIEMLDATGMRREELASVKVADLRESEMAVEVRHGKGDKARTVRYNEPAAKALGKYLRARKKHKHSALPELWIGWGGALSASGIRTMLRRTSDAAGVKVTAHEFRRRYVNRYLGNGGSPYNLQRMMGWSDATVAKMINRYGAEQATARAMSEYDRIGM